MADLRNIRLESLQVGAVPIVAEFLKRLDLERILHTHLAPKTLGRPARVPPARVLAVLVTNVLLARRPLYAIPAWLQLYVPDHFGLTSEQLSCFNDDRLGRTLDLLFEAEQASLVTSLVLRAIEEFDVQLSQLHNDSTTVTFSGAYRHQDADHDRAPWITYGFNKDHRPDLKQLVYELTISADGAVPLHFKTHDGNVTDDQTHRHTWSVLRDLVGHPDFCYVADSKLCVSDTLRFIAGEGGTFITVLPKTRAEDGWFKSYLCDNVIDWQEVRRGPDPRNRSGDDIVYHGFESPQHSKEGFRILWYKSSQKLEQDQCRRFERIATARRKIDALGMRRGRHAFKSKDRARQAADEIIEKYSVTDYLKVSIETRRQHARQQIGPGRPGPNTRSRRVVLRRIVFVVKEDGDAIAADALADGLFPLITNSKSLTLAEALDKYKYQPFLEKRNQQLKSVLNVAPVFLKRPSRIASLLFVDFISLLVYALIEREVRRQMKRRDIPSLQLYPEERPCRRPTADLVLGLFADHRRHRLIDADGHVHRTYYDPLPTEALTLLDLLSVDPTPYGVA